MDQIDLFVDQFTFSSKFNCSRRRPGYFHLALEEISPLASQKAEFSRRGCELHRRTHYLDH